MTQLVQLVETLFALRGYDVQPTPGGHVLRFARAGQHVAVRVREGHEPLPATVAHEAAETLPALGHAVLVCPGEIGHEARRVLEAAGVDVWTRDKLVHEIGATYLDAAQHGRLPKGFPPPVVTEEPDAPEATAAPAPQAGPPAPEPAPQAPAPAATPVPSLWARRAAEAPARPPAIPLTPTLVQASPAPAPAAASLPAAPAPLTATIAALTSAAAAPAPPVATAPPPAPTVAPPRDDGPSQVLALGLDREAAVKLAVGRLLKVDRASLELVPVHAFRYACRLEAPGATPIPKQGLLGVDAVTGAVRELAEPRFGPVPPEGGRLQSLVPDGDAPTAVKRRVVELHTQKMRVQSTLGRNSLIVEDKVVRPDPRAIELQSQGTWWLPVWRLEGQNGTVRIHGVTGTIEEAKLKKAFHETAEFL